MLMGASCSEGQTCAWSRQDKRPRHQHFIFFDRERSAAFWLGLVLSFLRKRPRAKPNQSTALLTSYFFSRKGIVGIYHQEIGAVVDSRNSPLLKVWLILVQQYCIITGRSILKGEVRWTISRYVGAFVAEQSAPTTNVPQAVEG